MVYIVTTKKQGQFVFTIFLSGSNVFFRQPALQISKFRSQGMTNNCIALFYCQFILERFGLIKPLHKQKKFKILLKII
jgi:hypothetical protein